MSEHQHHDEHEHHGHGAGLETSAARATQPGVAHDDHAGHDHAGHDHAAHDHSAHDHGAHNHGAHNHGGHAGHDPAQFRKLFWISLLLTVPTLVFSTGLQDILGLGGPRFPGSEWIPAVFGAAITVIGGRIFLTGAWHELRGKSPGMMTLISLAIVVSFGYSAAVMFGLPGMDFWWELSTLITIMLLGHWIEMSAVHGAQNALGELAKLLPDEAEVLRDGEPVTVARSELAIGDHVLVRPGAAIPADGRVVEGAAEVDESLLTGESTPVDKAAGAEVVAGSIASGSLTIEVTRTGGDTALAGIMKLVADAQASRSPAQLLADRAAALLFYVAVGAAVITLAVWWLLRPDDPSFVLERVVAVLVIACPHALGLAIPLVAQISTALAAKRGILIRSRAALEDAKDVDVVLFDKTGTLTEGKPKVTDVVGVAKSEGEVLRFAAALEVGSSHPLAKAILAAAEERKIPVFGAKGGGAVGGKGVTGTVGPNELFLGSPKAAAERTALPTELSERITALNDEGKTVSVLLVNGEVAGAIAMRDEPRPDAKEGIEALKRLGAEAIMLTGDNQRTAAAIAAQLGMEPRAELLPEDKQRIVGELKAQGKIVAKVGDGINDAPALAAADIGIAMGGGTDVALETADAAVLHGRVLDIANMIMLSRATTANIMQNITISLGLKAFFLVTTVIGVTGLWPAILADTGATVLVTANAMRLLVWKGLTK